MWHAMNAVLTCVLHEACNGALLTGFSKHLELISKQLTYMMLDVVCNDMLCNDMYLGTSLIPLIASWVHPIP